MSIHSKDWPALGRRREQNWAGAVITGVLVALLVAAVLAFRFDTPIRHWGIRLHLVSKASAGEVFESVRIGDREDWLVQTLDRYGVAYEKCSERGQIRYQEWDGLIPRFYLVEEGRVVGAFED